MCIYILVAGHKICFAETAESHHQSRARDEGNISDHEVDLGENDIMQELGMEGFQTESGGFVHDKPGVGTTGFQVSILPSKENVKIRFLFNPPKLGAICPGLTWNCTNW